MRRLEHKNPLDHQQKNTGKNSHFLTVHPVIRLKSAAQIFVCHSPPLFSPPRFWPHFLASLQRLQTSTRTAQLSIVAAPPQASQFKKFLLAKSSSSSILLSHADREAAESSLIHSSLCATPLAPRSIFAFQIEQRRAIAFQRTVWRII